MQILLAFIFGGVIGAAAHFALPGRDTRGAALLIMAGIVSGGLVWLILTWVGLGPENVIPWLAAVVVPFAVTFGGGILLTRARDAHDARERARLKISPTTS